ncbi:Geranylgeranyl transferase type-2 subunit alpha [Candida maltosa Xu316]|uniref:Geranylgeranyl transferase type-2 subunit alpha n=1 Tax=Candida maltosa (strain Xu316) TaxID=1245528 RepID=M3JWX1_CANMX|nr:Geranylgeranyl transferase type-2 subunit alpha [Candida maltosa Xu316]
MQHGVKRVSLSEEAKRSKLEKDQIKIKKYRDLTSEIFELRDKKTYNDEALLKTNEILLINPEFYTMWNYRREILNTYKPDLTVYEDILNQDLNFVLAQLKRFPKCYWIWNHRRWLLFELVSIGKVNWKYEFGIVSKLLELDQRNYHGWHYRRFVVSNMELECKDDLPKILKINLDEFNYTTQKIQKDFSNFSAWHNRAKLIPKIHDLIHKNQGLPSSSETDLFQNTKSILDNDLEMIKTGIYMSPEDTSVWYYLQWLLSDPFFKNGFESKEDYLEVLNQQLQVIDEVNEMEKEDTGKDNVGCLKNIVFIKSLIQQENNQDKLTDEIKEALKILTEIDPLRKNKYLQQLAGKVEIC